MSFLKKTINYLFALLFFLVPLVLFPETSELFEFNKMVLTYALTVLIAFVWLSRMVVERKIIFKRTFLDIPLVIFLLSQLLSTLVSVDTRTSFLGYYSRFHGGLLSTISYTVLYWAYVSNIKRKGVKKSFYALFASALVVSIYGILQHFGIDAHIWVQDVQSRVFSTLGQPNWLAAFIVALTPLTWAFAISAKEKNSSRLFWYILSSVFFLVLLYTKSRSGLLGFATGFFVFWGGYFLTTSKEKVRKSLRSFTIITLIILILTLVEGTPWTPKITNLGKSTPPPTQQKVRAPALETGGTESGEIRKIVWTGAIDIWKNYPILGTGVETFAFSYYNFRPAEHNLVSEWNYLYNKAHNEYLNFAATTGTIGLLSYTLLIMATVYLFIKTSGIKIKGVDKKSKNKETLALAAGYFSILATNFFGFSVVPVALLFFLFPAMAVALQEKESEEPEKTELSGGQKLTIAMLLAAASYLLLIVGRYWYADYIYAKGKMLNDAGNPSQAREFLQKSVKLSPNEAIYWNELSQTTTKIAVFFSEEGKEKLAEEFARSSIVESQRAVDLSPANVNIRRDRASIFVKLSIISPDYLVNARNTLIKAVEIAPTDALLHYNLALSYIRTGEIQKAIETLKKTIELKPDYRDPHFALGLLYIDEGEEEKAIEKFEFILENINPNDKQTKRELDELR